MQKESTPKNSEDFQTNKQKKERIALHLFFYAAVNEYELTGTNEVKDYYFIFKKTDTNDTLFQFSYFGANDKVFKELGYKGFLEVDSFKDTSNSEFETSIYKLYINANQYLKN